MTATMEDRHQVIPDPADEQETPSQILEDPERLLTIIELSNYLRIPVGSIRNWRPGHVKYAGGPPRIKVGRNLRFRVRDVNEWLDRQTNG